MGSARMTRGRALEDTNSSGKEETLASLTVRRQGTPEAFPGWKPREDCFCGLVSLTKEAERNTVGLWTWGLDGH